MAEDDDAPVRKRIRLEKLVLDTLGIEELRDYITELREEIARVEATSAASRATAVPPMPSSASREAASYAAACVSPGR